MAAGAPGAIGLVRHGNRTWQAAAGTAQAGAGVPMLPGDHVRIGSVTKTFTAVVVLQLVAGHLLRLQDTVNRWLPGALPYGGQVTVGELLHHTSGIPEYLNKIAELYATQPGSWLWHWSPAQLLALVSAEPPLFPPGTRWAYSNTDYILLGMIIQRVTGHSPARRSRGLSIVRAIAAAHGAAITAHARTGGGLSIEVTFPAIPDEPPPVAPALSGSFPSSLQAAAAV